MLDFNDDPADASIDSSAQRDAVRSDLLARLESVLFTLFPAGKKRRGKLLIGDVLGSPGDSLEVVLDGEKSGLYCCLSRRRRAARFSEGAAACR